MMSLSITSNLNDRLYFPQKMTESTNLITENNNVGDIQQVWSKYCFDDKKLNSEVNFNNNTMSWATKLPAVSEEIEESPSPVNSEGHQQEPSSDSDTVEEPTSPSHHARRPMNAFLIFCKKHRPIVRENFPSLENRGVTKILGEWWSLLNEGDKKPYTDLAKEYKDNFMSENPDFKWYKLPAPPLRTLTTRPAIAPNKPLPQTITNTITPTIKAEFTPGKLADESQLGSLTTLMNNNNLAPAPKIDKEIEYNNNMSSKSEKLYDLTMVSPVNTITSSPSMPPKPIKKRYNELKNDNNHIVARNILNSDDTEDSTSTSIGTSASANAITTTGFINMTKQDIVDRGIENLFTKNMDQNGLTETRKSGRSCKGKRYEQFMVEGKLLGNKRDVKLTQQKFIDVETKIESQLNSKLESKPETPKLGLESTIKRLAERTNIKLAFENESNGKSESISELCEDMKNNSSQSSNFNLDLRISNLPSLSYDMYVQKKRESKKRKSRTRSESELKKKLKQNEEVLVGSKKRKNKMKITHLNANNDSNNANIFRTTYSNDLSPLDTLAEVAALAEVAENNNEKLNDQIISQ